MCLKHAGLQHSAGEVITHQNKRTYCFLSKPSDQQSPDVHQQGLTARQGAPGFHFQPSTCGDPFKTTVKPWSLPTVADQSFVLWKASSYLHILTRGSAVVSLGKIPNLKSPSAANRCTIWTWIGEWHKICKALYTYRPFTIFLLNYSCVICCIVFTDFNLGMYVF